jgi:capsular exopolysaccharide synthesis family protein
MMPPIVKSYLIAFKKYKWIGMASFIVVLAGATIVALKPQPPTSYIASGSLAYTSQPVSFSKTGSEIQEQGKELNEDFLLSDQILDTVATRLKLDSKNISTNINLNLPKKNKAGELETNIIGLQYIDRDPYIAKNVLDELMKEMVLSSQNLNSGRLKEIIQKINLLLPQAKRELQIAEKKLEKYDRKERPAILFAENGSLLSAITMGQNQQRQIKLTIAGIKAQIQSLENKLGLTVNRAYVASALSADPIIANLRTQIYQTESQIALLRKDLRPEHPTMIQLRRQQQAAEELLKKRAAEVLGGNGVAAPFAGDVSGIRTQSSLDPTRQALANQLVTLQTQQDTLQEQLKQQISQEAQLRQQYSAIPNKQLERSRLEEVVTLKKAIYDQIEAKLTDAKAAEAETVSSLSIVKQTSVKPAIVKAKSVPVTLGIGGFIGAGLGTVIIFLLGSMEGILRTEEDIRKIFIPRDVQILGELPFMSTDNINDNILPVITLLNSDYLELYETFRSNLRRINGKNLKVLMIASISHEEGKTVTAYNLGIASARAGKRTLIVEMDWRSPTRSTSLKVSPDPEAFNEPLLYYSNLGECIRLVPEVENLYIIPSPGAMQHSATIIESSEIRQLMADVRERFDLVILDTSPLSFSNDPYLIQPYSDGIILVTRPNYTKGTLLGEIIDQLLEDGLELIGGAINGADIPVKISTSESAMPLEMPITSPAGGASATSAKLDELSMSVGKS